MDAKRPLQNTTQYQANGHRVNTGSSKTHVMKNGSQVSLSPSQAAEQAKINERKHPLDALSKLPNKQTTVERRSGLQDVDEEYLKQNVFRKPFFPRNSGLYDVNVSQNQMANTPAAGQPSIPPSEGFITNQTNSQVPLKSPQQNYQQQIAANLSPSHIQLQSQAQSATVPMPQQQNQQVMNSKNQIINPAISIQQDLHHQQQQINSNPNSALHGNSHQNCGQPPTHIYNNIVSAAEPEMCTTCPNCQTTIYLVRSTEVNPDMSQQLSNNGGQQTIGDNNVGAASVGSA